MELGVLTPVAFFVLARVAVGSHADLGDLDALARGLDFGVGREPADQDHFVYHRRASGKCR